MLKHKNILKLAVLISLVVIIVIGLNYVYKDHRNIQAEAPSFVVQSKSFLLEFANNPLKAEKKYLNKTIEISGIITEKHALNLVIDGSIFCQFQNNINEDLNTNTPVIVKGRCLGFDELLEEVKIDQSILIHK